ncbi:MAG: YceD family protein [Pseudomonadota bacterium]
MKHDYDAQHLNIEAFAKANGSTAGTENLARFERLLEEAQGAGAQNPVHFTAKGMTRPNGATSEQIWLVLAAKVALPQTCQRCLGPVDVPVSFEREFRFVASEAVAEVEDEESEEDVLVLSREFNLLELVEDELLMALPVVPKHDVCPGAVKLQVADPDFAEEEQEKPNPFAVLGQLKKKP